MIWLRRAFTLPLILIFIVLIDAAVHVTAVNNTTADPDFYNNLMTEADMYNYVYDSVLPAALDAIDISGHQGVEAVMLDKADEVAIDAAGSFVNDMQDMYMYMMIASGVGLAGVGVWWSVGSRGKNNVA